MHKIKFDFENDFQEKAKTFYFSNFTDLNKMEPMRCERCDKDHIESHYMYLVDHMIIPESNKPPHHLCRSGIFLMFKCENKGHLTCIEFKFHKGEMYFNKKTLPNESEDSK